MRVAFRHGNPFSFLFATTKREQYLTRYVLREHRRGRPFSEILGDPYVRNRSTPEQRTRLLERPEVVAAIGEHALAELRLALTAGAVAGSATQLDNDKQMARRLPREYELASARLGGRRPGRFAGSRSPRFADEKPQLVGPPGRGWTINFARIFRRRAAR
jgi:hypothetical protein